MKRSSVGIFLVSLGICSLFCLAVLGFQILNPFNGNWPTTGDIAHQHLAWLYYRVADWSWPLTQNDRMLYPIGSTILTSDTVPILSILFKIIRGVLPENFQFFGLLYLLNINLLFLFSYLTFTQLQLTKTQSFLGSILVASSPVFWIRLGHPGLTSHWLIIALFYSFGVIQYSPEKSLKALILAALVSFLSFGIEPYFVPMCWTLYLGLIFQLTRNHQTCPISRRNIFAIFFFSILLSIFWALALGYGEVQDPTNIGFGNCSSDLVSFFNPGGVSTFLPTLRGTWCMYEGIAYHGLGFWSLFAFAWYLKKYRGFNNSGIKTTFKVMIVGLLFLAFYSFASPIRFGGNPILYIDFLYKLFDPLPSIFRSSGRLMWPLYYALEFYLIYFICQQNKKITVLLIAIAVQSIDLGPYFYRIGAQNTQANTEGAELAKVLPGIPVSADIKFTHVFPLWRDYDASSKINGFSHDQYLVISRWIAQHHLITSSGFLGRISKASRQQMTHQEELLESFLKEDRDRSIYIFHPDHFEKFESLLTKYGINCNNNILFYTCLVKTSN
jgi:hypothetical protein